MKFLSLSILFFLSATTFAQKKLPNIVLKDINGSYINLPDITNHGKPFVIIFCSTFSILCKKKLSAISHQYKDWQRETGVKIYAIYIDNQNSVDNVKPFVSAQGWEYEILLDTNGELKRALGVNNVPFTLLLDGNGNVVWKHNNYNPGDENELYEKIVKLSAE
jgi:peroxiredoxin